MTTLLENPLLLLFAFIKTWYWFFLPFCLWPIVKKAWLWERREAWESRQKYSFLEIIPPREVKQPLSAAESVFAAWWTIYSSIEGIKNFRKKFLEGRRRFHITIEIVSFGPFPHFYLRVNKKHKATIESAFYSQYPTAEIREVEDFTKKIPFNAPDSKWNIYVFDMVPQKPEAYPLKTYRIFFEEKPELVKEEKRIDPIGTLLEGLNQLKEDEIIWIQFRIEPITPKERNYMREAKELVDKLLHRKEKIPKEGGFIPPEMKLSPREKETVKAIEDKIGKQVFDSNLRCIYFGKKEIFQSIRRTLAEQFFTSFNTPDLQIIKRWGKTKSKIRHFFIKRRLYYRNRRMMRWFLMREPTGFPKRMGNFILSTEELATLFHPPINIEELGTFLPRTELRKKEAPPYIPFEKKPKEGSVLPKPFIKKKKAPPETPSEE